MLFFWSIEKPAPYTPARPIHLSLNKIYVAPPETPADVTPQDLIAKPATKATTNPNTREQIDLSAEPRLTPANPEQGATPVEDKPRIVTHLSPDDLKEIYQQRAPGHALPQTDSISRNVFHPGLRERLIAEENKPVLQRADAGPKTHMDPSGATIVDLDGGGCLRSPAPKLGEAQDWYMTSCGGKSESEEMMERVDQAVNGKLRFESQ